MISIASISGRALTAWYCATALAMMAVGGVLQRAPVWIVESGRANALLGVSLAYAAGGLILGVIRAQRGTVTFLEAVTTMLATFGVVLLYVVITDEPFSRRTMLIAGSATAILTLLPFILPRRVMLVGTAVALASLLPAVLATGVVGAAPRGMRTVLIPGHIYTLSATIDHDVMPYDSIRGGGVTRAGDRVIAATGSGSVYTIDASGSTVVATSMDLSVPINRDAFLASTAGTSVHTGMFRVMSVLGRKLAGDSTSLLVSHHWWKADSSCFVLRVSETVITDDAAPASDDAPWRTLFESSPCLKLKTKGRIFNGAQSGGRMAELDERTVLLTVGDHEFDGVHSDLPLAQDSISSYGKILAVDVITGQARAVSVGHRNPQGLTIKRDGSIWATEHGPQGGDELNRIIPGANYGWPLETYGTNYGAHFWPLASARGRHDQFTAPVYSWVPSIGVSAIIEMTSPVFGEWDGDLLVASLVGGTLYHVRVSGDGVRFAEPLSIGERIRDLVELQDGRILLYIDHGSLGVLEPARADAEAGELLFAKMCAACHAMMDGKTHGTGPDLEGIVSRRVASARGYVYSDVLRRVGGRWTAARLDALMKDGQRFAPGMAMPDLVVSDSATRAAIVRYLRSRQ